MATSNQLFNAVSVRLDDTNYPTWHFLMQHYLRGLGLLKFVNGSYPCPPLFQRADHDSLSVDNTEAYEKWLQQDSYVICLIITSLSADALTLVVGCQTSMEVWLTLKQRYATVSEFHIMQLKSNLQAIRKGSDSIDKYLLRFKHVRNQLAAIGVNMSDEDIKTLILAGLPSEYAHTRQIIRSKNSITMAEVRSLLLSAEFEIELEHKALPLSSLAAMVALNGVANFSSQNGQLSMPIVAQSQGFYNSSYMNGCSVPSYMSNAAQKQGMYYPSYANGCSGMMSGMNSVSHSPTLLPNMSTMSHFNATPTTATTQIVPSSNTLTASVGFSNGANFGPSQTNFDSTVQQNNGYSQYNNGRSNAGNFNGSNGYLENNNGGYSQNINEGYSTSNGGVSRHNVGSYQKSRYSNSEDNHGNNRSFNKINTNGSTRISSKLQPKAAGIQRIESDDLRQLPTHIMKVTKSELVAPEMLLKSVQNSSMHVVIAASDNRRSENSNDTGSVDLLNSELNSISLSPNLENASKEGDSAVNQSRGSLESYVDPEKKILEYGSVKDSSVSAKVSDGFSSTVESQVQAAFLTSKPVPVSIATPISSRSKDVIPFPCTSSERPLLNCRQASQPMELWRSLFLISPG